MNLLLRFYDPTAGEIRLDGQRLDALPVEYLREHTGVVPQDPIVFRSTLADNVRYGSPHADEDTVLAAARAALVDEIAARLPQGYDTLVGEGGHVLSQGERQRIAIARVFCKNPSLVVLDEATSALDRSSEALVERALGNCLTGRTTFVIAHRLQTVITADQIVVIDRGRVVQVGKHEELLADIGGLYRRLCECQLGPFPTSTETADPSLLEAISA
jgi:ABC-type multidrug transport system fused ATPase/permease subunit